MNKNLPFTTKYGECEQSKINLSSCTKQVQLSHIGDECVIAFDINDNIIRILTAVIRPILTSLILITHKLKLKV